jgi:putative flavoprotein involved in K+ transport
MQQELNSTAEHSGTDYDTDNDTFYDTIIVGGGQGGLATSYFLTQKNQRHIILEQASCAAPAWKEGRWDSFTLVTPNWAFLLPGAEYQGDQPDEFLTRDQVVAAFEGYVKTYTLPIVFNTQVTSVEKNPDNNQFIVRTGDTVYRARNVVVATGLFQQPRVHADADKIPPDIQQLHSGAYRNPSQLPNGAVLVVGSSQSGCQIAQELHASGRRVFLCVGKSGRAPRRYRGKDSFEWARLLGISERPASALSSAREKYAANPHMSGKKLGGDINLHQFARNGIQLLGRLNTIDQYSITLAPGLKKDLEFADNYEAAALKGVDAYIEKNNLDIPKEILPQFTDGYDVEPIEQFDLKAAGITSIIWAIGYKFDFNLVKFPVFDADGYPIQQRGATAQPGLFFIGLPWLQKQKSGLIMGVGEDAAHVASLCE